MPPSTGPPPATEISPAYARYVLGVLFLVGVFALVDRQIFGMLIEPIRREFEVSDTWLGLASGLSFALFYAAAVRWSLALAALTSAWSGVHALLGARALGNAGSPASLA